MKFNFGPCSFQKTILKRQRKPIASHFFCLIFSNCHVENLIFELLCCKIREISSIWCLLFTVIQNDMDYFSSARLKYCALLMQTHFCRWCKKSLHKTQFQGCGTIRQLNAMVYAAHTFQLFNPEHSTSILLL